MSRFVNVTTTADEIAVSAPIKDGDVLGALYDVAIGALAELCGRYGITSAEAIEHVIPAFAKSAEQEMLDVPFPEGVA